MTTPAPPLTEAELISPEQAHESHQRLVDHYFGNPAERPRIHIPARPTKDDDLVVSSYIDQSSARIAALESELAEANRERYAAINEMAKARRERMDAQARGDLNAWLVHEFEEEREGLVKRLWDKSKELHARNLKLESELAQLRREKAERDALERRIVDWLGHESTYAIPKRKLERCPAPPGEVLVALQAHDLPREAFRTVGTGPTYEAALAAALAEVEKAV